eukprot:CAMPEP_0185908642 /NCGR_PEP_ID=MMETSP0196C-20130402/9325_1 /TAXON_ID=2932 /ORGANISM="Alexandrium fundyense, Strain CCMP1719" /LENGTH=36 /DNA_ID= /DNA_START= /DNA_END= /DNA_ORIENTATION=
MWKADSAMAKGKRSSSIISLLKRIRSVLTDMYMRQT